MVKHQLPRSRLRGSDAFTALVNAVLLRPLLNPHSTLAVPGQYDATLLRKKWPERIAAHGAGTTRRATLRGDSLSQRAVLECTMPLRRLIGRLCTLPRWLRDLWDSRCKAASS